MSVAIPFAGRPRIEAIGPGDIVPLLALNNAHAQELSWLEPDRFQLLAGEAFMACRIGEADAFLFAFDQDANYDSPNFGWFRERHDRFVYVDRVVVAKHARGRKLARRLYEHLIAKAKGEGHETLCAEVNLVPPNPLSDTFHKALGFTEAGRAVIHDGAKTVRYFSRRL